MPGVAFQITDTTPLEAELKRRVSAKALENAAFKSVVECMRPIVLSASARAPVYRGKRKSGASGTHDGGSLKRAIGFTIRKYRKSKTVYGVAGAIRGNGIGDAEPANYAHLVEFGHRDAKSGKQVAAKPFLRPAFDSQKAKAAQRLKTTFGREVQLEFYKKAKKR